MKASPFFLVNGIFAGYGFAKGDFNMLRFGIALFFLLLGLLGVSCSLRLKELIDTKKPYISCFSGGKAVYEGQAKYMPDVQPGEITFWDAGTNRRVTTTLPCAVVY